MFRAAVLPQAEPSQSHNDFAAPLKAKASPLDHGHRQVSDEGAGIHRLGPFGRGIPLVASSGGLVMRHFDLSPLYRSTIGFDRLASLLDAASGLDGDGGGFPPYNIERLAETSYRITMAVAGFTDADLKIEVKETVLTVKGEKNEPVKETEFLHRGIAQRAFERRFQLADHVEVVGAEIKDGLLHIDLVRNLPERMKPRLIAIRSSNETPKQIEAHT
jgi:molecular chaperone IbpA